MKGNERICRQCLLRDMPEQEAYREVRRLLRNLDEDVRAEEEIYRGRLESCRTCASLLDGMCRLCGCFVELRAAVRTNRCPAAERRW